MTPARITAALTADFAIVLVVAYGWQGLTGDGPPWWVGALVGLAAFTVAALFWPPARRGRHRCPRPHPTITPRHQEHP